MKRSLRMLLAGYVAMGIILWVALPGAGVALAAPDGDNPIQDLEKYQQIRPDSELIGQDVFYRAMENGDKPEEAARKAGSAAGRKAVSEGAHPVYAADIASGVVRRQGGTFEGEVDAAIEAYTNGGGKSGGELGYVINRIVWAPIARIGNEIRGLVARRDNATGETRRELQTEIDKKGQDLSGLLNTVIAKASGAARAAGLSPEEEGEAIARAVGGNFAHLRTSLQLTGQDLGGLIRNHLNGTGRGLTPLDQGVVAGQAFNTLGNRLSASQRNRLAQQEAYRAVETAGGTDADKVGVQQRLFSDETPAPSNRQGSRSQSRADAPNEDAGRLAAIGRMMGGLEETSGTSVQTPYGGDDENLLAKAREGSKKYEVRARESRDHSSPVSGGGGESHSGNEAGGSTSGETEVAGSGAMKAVDPPSTEVATSAASGTSSFVGSWKGDGGCSLNSISISANYTLKGAGPDIPLSVNGNEATGSGAVLFGKGGHRLRFRINLDQMQMDGSNDEGGSCVSIFLRVKF